jgi:hypothetical protein
MAIKKQATTATGTTAKQNLRIRMPPIWQGKSGALRGLEARLPDAATTLQAAFF